MRHALAILAVTMLAACGSAPNAASVDEHIAGLIAQTYTFGIAEAPNEGCLVTLKTAPISRAAGYAIRPLELGAGCAEKYGALRAVTRWALTGGGSIALFGGAPVRERADFSPVQGGEGVYLRGGFAGDAKVYELWPPQ